MSSDYAGVYLYVQVSEVSVRKEEEMPRGQLAPGRRCAESRVSASPSFSDAVYSVHFTWIHTCHYDKIGNHEERLVRVMNIEVTMKTIMMLTASAIAASQR